MEEDEGAQVESGRSKEGGGVAVAGLLLHEHHAMETQKETQKKHLSWFVGLATGALLFASTAVASAEVLRYELDTAASDLVVHVHRKGLLSPLLHDHFFHPTNWSGKVSFDRDKPEQASVVIEVAANSLKDRQAQLSEEDRRKVEAQVRSREILDAERYPEISFASERLELSPQVGDDPSVLRGTLVGSLTLHGQTKSLRVPVAARWSPEWLLVNGNVSFNQSDFGIEPYSTALGAIAVKDRVDLSFSIRAARAR